MRHAIFVRNTGVAGNSKVRYQCPHCKENKAPESRFNRAPETKGVITCRFCKKEIIIK